MIYFIVLAVLLIWSYYIWWLVNDKQKYSKCPPGPLRLPFLGSLLSIPQSPYPSLSFQKLAESYGEVISVKMGYLDAVSFNSFESVKAILNGSKADSIKQDIHNAICERQMHRNLGIAFCNGETWMNLRRFTIRTLRNLGFGKMASMDIAINQELDKLLKKIKSQIASSPKKGLQAEEMFTQALTHILWRLVTGKDYELGDPKMNRLMKINDGLLKSLDFGADITIAYPFLWSLFPNWSRKNWQVKAINDLKGFAKETIQEHKISGLYKNDPDCFVDAFLSKIVETKDDPNSDFNEDHLMISIVDLFQAGGDTSSKTLSFCMLYMLLHQNIQEKVWKEIDSVIGKDEMITLDMRAKLPYTHATLLECLRKSSVLPFTPPRLATEDFIFNEYLIRKGTALMINLQAAHDSKSRWGDPQNFRPERFFNEDGFVDSKVAKYLVSFGDGKRDCLGQSLAESSMFIFFVTILRAFQLSHVPGTPKPSLEPKAGITYSPQPFKILFVPRV